MNSTDQAIKVSRNGLILCAVCIFLKSKSRRFPSMRALRHHVTSEHKDDLQNFRVRIIKEEIQY